MKRSDVMQLQHLSSFFVSLDITNLATQMGLAFNTNAFVGGLFLTIILVCCTVMFPVYKGAYKLATGIFILDLVFTTAVTWLNVYVFIIVLFALAVGLAIKFKEIFS